MRERKEGSALGSLYWRDNERREGRSDEDLFGWNRREKSGESPSHVLK